MKKVTLCIFIDALGWAILERHPSFLADLLPHRKALESILGYSSACDPSIISGRMPQEHGHWSSFFWAPEAATYKWTRFLSFLPSWLLERSRVRHQLSKLIKKTEGFTGYFQVYQFPFKWLPYFDYAEKQRIWVKGGMNQGRSLFDECAALNIPHYVGDQDSEKVQWEQAEYRLREGSVSFIYLLMGKLDAVMHAKGTKDPAVALLLNEYAEKVRALLKTAASSYDEVDLFLFSDHGMHDVIDTVDLQAIIERLGLSFGEDYAAVYDSTMARFWFFKEHARQKIEAALSAVDRGTLLSDDELKDYGVYFEDRKYGESIFLLNPGVLIVPSFMGRKAVAGMHGYEPQDNDSLAVLMSNKPIPAHTTRIEQIYDLIHHSLQGKYQ